MNIHIREDNIEVTQAARAHVKRRLELALSRFSDRINIVSVVLSDAKGIDGQLLDKRCEIKVTLRQKGVRVEDSDADLMTAIDRAADRILRSITRVLERERHDELPH